MVHHYIKKEEKTTMKTMDRLVFYENYLKIRKNTFWANVSLLWYFAKLNACRFSLPSLRLIHENLSNRKQRTKIDDDYSSWLEILSDILQRSILGLLLFNIFLADLFFVVIGKIIASCADDSTPFIKENNIDNVIASLEQVFDALFNSFKNNRLKNNVDKCHVLVQTNKMSSEADLGLLQHPRWSALC